MVLSKQAREFFRNAGRRGGKARLKKMTAEQRKAVAAAGANARWRKSKTGEDPAPIPPAV